MTESGQICDEELLVKKRYRKSVASFMMRPAPIHWKACSSVRRDAGVDDAI